MDFNIIFANCLAVSNLRLADVSLDVKLALHAVDQNFKVKLTHTGDNCLAGFIIHAYTECRILFGQALQRGAHLFLVGFGLWLDGDRYRWFREGNVLEHNRVVRVTQGVTGGGAFKAHDCGDIARSDFGDIGTLVGLQTNNTANTLFFAGGAV